jgi:flagellar hook-basal body complex protein FliE
MNIVPLTTVIPPISGGISAPSEEIKAGQPTFLDVFSQIFKDAVSTDAIKSEDMIRLMLGETDNLAEIMLNAQKAELATDLLVNVRNTVLDSYNEIIRMQI